MNDTRSWSWRHEAAAAGVLTLVHVVLTTLLAATTAVAVVPFLAEVGVMFGVVIGLVTAPGLYVCVRNKEPLLALGIIYGATTAVAVASSTTQSPMLALQFTLLAFVLMSVAVWLLLPRVRPRFAAGHCQTCGYDLTGNVSGRCPECGTAADSAITDRGGNRVRYAALAIVTAAIVLPMITISIRTMRAM
jgi:hypothetical protein